MINHIEIDFSLKIKKKKTYIKMWKLKDSQIWIIGGAHAKNEWQIEK
jgi:hypothetical protein